METPTPVAPRGDKLVLTPVHFSALPGWDADAIEEALPAFERSCHVLLQRPPHAAIGSDGISSLAQDWRAPCLALREAPRGQRAAARAFFERWFSPHLVANNEKRDGLFTGYYEPELRGARQRTTKYDVPLYLRPPELITADLGEFGERFKGARIAGHVVGGRLRPYLSRAQIVAGAIANRNLELIWVDDAIDAFFLQIQGSGRVILDDETVVRVGYDGANGHPYTAIGRELVRRGALARENITMQSIRAWLGANAMESAAVMNVNASYVFFREVKGDGPIGSQGAVLTPGRSLAVDRRYIPLGAPVWLDTTDPLAGKRPLRRLLIAQDTGGAILGPVRGDVFWGHGAVAVEHAGRMQSRGSYYVLLPRSIAAPTS